ncbi:argininosuccinate lyase [Holotrichia oblita]|uniref:Argininosuccinate lyase n=1 Tax=Holotrichia oblita TaxID=644536 RepID=A0ACB9T3Z4_HOLOL|nr:argininosuccinate lyase [Holotrichia oblita]
MVVRLTIVGTSFTQNAIDMVSKAWSIPSDTIKNCFRHAGFVPQSLHTDFMTPENFSAEDDLPLAQWLQHIKDVDNVSPLEEYLHFVNFNEDVETCGELTDDDILSDIRHISLQEHQDDSDSDSEGNLKFTPPDVSEAMNALSIVRHFITFNNMTSEDLIPAVEKLEKAFEEQLFATTKQSKITDYLHSNKCNQ